MAILFSLAKTDLACRCRRPRFHLIMGKGRVLTTVSLALLFSPFVLAERPRISEDRELKEIDLAGWDCRDRPEGVGKTPDALERNRLKNRPAATIAGALPATMDTAAFLRYVAAFDAQTQGKRRKDLSPSQRSELDKYEKQLVSLTGYLVLAYAGPPESTNCASTDFHDWHLELFSRPSDHPPRAGDPTSIICEIAPRTQNAIFRDGIRLQELAAFIRAPDLSYEPTGHPARKIRVVGNLLWDDDHNGSVDVGPTVRTAGANKYHNPWRATAWEVHPVVKIEFLDENIPAREAARATSVPADFDKESQRWDLESHGRRIARSEFRPNNSKPHPPDISWNESGRWGGFVGRAADGCSERGGSR